MSFAASMVAAMAGLFGNKGRKQPVENQTSLTKWFHFETLDGRYWVDFCEEESELLKRITIGENIIRFQGQVFTLKNEYWVNELGNTL